MAHKLCALRPSLRMRLVTHNILMCNKKGCTQEHFPLHIEATKIEQRASEFNADFIRHMLPKLEWHALVSGAKDVRLAHGHPTSHA